MVISYESVTKKHNIFSFSYFYFLNCTTNSDLCSWLEFTRSSSSFIHFVSKQKNRSILE